MVVVYAYFPFHPSSNLHFLQQPCNGSHLYGKVPLGSLAAGKEQYRWGLWPLERNGTPGVSDRWKGKGCR